VKSGGQTSPRRAELQCWSDFAVLDVTRNRSTAENVRPRVHSLARPAVDAHVYGPVQPPR
jgi:hypothetical protein